MQDRTTQPIIQAFFDQPTHTVTYVVAEAAGPNCVIIDPVLGYDPKSGRTDTLMADQVVEFVTANNLNVKWILETHVHADHLSAAPYLKQSVGGQLGISQHITDVQRVFSEIFHTDHHFSTDGSQFDHLLADGEVLEAGELRVLAMHTPGHTPACMTYLMGDAAFVGDTLFMPDYGTARADFPGGDAATLYQSIQKLLALPDATRMFMCHDYLPSGRNNFEWETTVAAQRDHNVHVGAGATEQEFVSMRKTRDSTLDMPVLLLPAIQVNMRAGEFPPPESNGVSYLKIPVDRV